MEARKDHPRGSFVGLEFADHLERHHRTDHYIGDFVIVISNSIRFPDCAVDMQIVSTEPTIKNQPSHTWPCLENAIAWLQRLAAERKAK